jgi:GNAT superfamily N-acetyltransferase
MSSFILPTGAYGEPLPLEWDEPIPIVPLPQITPPVDDRPFLVASPVETEADAIVMGRIRSAQAAHFSNDRAPFDDARQVAWWHEHRRRLVALLYRDQAGAVVGYGCLRQEDDGRWWSSVAVAPGHEGKGHGKRITHHLVTSVPVDVWASARNDRPKALALHDPLDWDTLGGDNDLTWFRTKPKIAYTGAIGYWLWYPKGAE